MLDLKQIEGLLRTREIGKPATFDNELWDSVDSTNNRAMALAKQGAPHGLIVLAREQTAGRGRLGRTWVSPPDSGLYMSFLLRPAIFKPQIPLITIASGLACAKAISFGFSTKIGIKWVNDLVLSGRKLGGILSELYLSPDATPVSEFAQSALIAGIGINIEPPGQGIPVELRSQMAWLSEIAPKGVDRNLLVAQIALELEQVLDLLSQQAIDEVLNGWRQYAVTLGESVIATIGDDQFVGVAIDIDSSGALILDTNAGRRTLTAGEVTIRQSKGSYV